MRLILVCLLICSFCMSCKDPEIEFENVDEIVNSIKKTETYLKKIPALPYLSNEYVEFGFMRDGHVSMIGSTFNYNPNDTTREGYINYQEMVDTCRTFSGLTVDEWQDLKKQFATLREIQIVFNDNAFYNDGKFQFFYYTLILPRYQNSGPFYLAVLSDDIVKTEDFKDRFVVLDKKGELYLLRPHWW